MNKLSEIRIRENRFRESFNVIHYIPLESAIAIYPGAARALVQAWNRLPFRFKSSDLEAILHWENDGAVATYEEAIDPADVENGCPSADFKRHKEICEEVRKSWHERFTQFVITAKAIEEMAQSGAIKLTAPGQNG
jgi:hypothetical protein